MFEGNRIIQRSSRGIPEIGLKPLEPLFINKIEIKNQESNSAVKVDLKFRQARLFGLSKGKVYRINGFRKDPEGNKLDIRVKVPLLTLTGPYAISGELFVLSLIGNGTATLKWENLDFVLKSLTRRVIKDGKVFAQIEKTKFNYETTR